MQECFLGGKIRGDHGWTQPQRNGRRFDVVCFSDFIRQSLVDNTAQDLVFADESVSNVTPTGQSNIVSIGSYPDGVNDAISINVPSGEAVTSIDLSLDENVLPVSAAKVWDSSADYDHPQAIYDGIDVNGTSLELLPQGWAYDMEGTNAWTFSGTNTWFWGYDSTLGESNGVTSGSKDLYT